MASTERRPDGFHSPRELTYLDASSRAPSDYEAATCYTQPDLGHFGTGGWFLLSDGGRPTFDPDSTAARHHDWFEFRDPSAMWERPYVAELDAAERALATATEEAATAGALADISPEWAVEVLGRYYDGFACAEWGLFLGLAKAVRAALSDTLTSTLVLAAVDRLRHQQDLALFSLDLEVEVPGYQSEGRACWLGDAVLAPTRLMVEHLMAATDWVEVMFAVGAVLDPLVSRLFLSQFLRRLAPLNGDIVTPTMILSVERDRRRFNAAVAALFRMLLDPACEYRDHNARLLRTWLARWEPLATDAMKALAPLFEWPQKPADCSFAAASCLVERQWSAWIEDLGLSPAGRR